MSYLIGIIGRDKDMALRILKDEIETNEQASPIIIDLTREHKSTGKEPILVIPKAKGYLCYPAGQSAVQTEELPKHYIKENSLPRDEEQTLRYALQKAKHRYMKPGKTLERRERMEIVKEVRKAFFNTIATLFLNY